MMEVVKKNCKKNVEKNLWRTRRIEILILIDRYIGVEKPQQLAKLYLAYLDGVIDWNELTK